MNTEVISNYSKLKRSLFYLPLSLLTIIILFLYIQNALTPYKYIQIQKNAFYFINSYLGQFPKIEYNFTQLGDASVLLSFLIILILYAPKILEALLSASLVSLMFSTFLKNLFSVPRPAQVYDNTSFIIIGKTAVGFSSLPSGHSITIFTTLTVLIFAFMPKLLKYKFLWVFSIISIGLIIAFSRVGVGAHHPLDVIIGCIIGYISGLLGIFINQKYEIWAWINNKKYYPIFITAMLICFISLMIKVNDENLIVFYFALISLFISLYKVIYVYLKK